MSGFKKFWTENGQIILLVFIIVTALASIPFIIVGVHFHNAPLIVSGIFLLVAATLIWGLRKFSELQLLPSKGMYTQI